VVFLDLRHFSTKTAKILGYASLIDLKIFVFGDLEKTQNGGDLVDGAGIDFLVFWSFKDLSKF
jgi:hypothetical protein